MTAWYWSEETDMPKLRYAHSLGNPDGELQLRKLANSHHSTG